MYNGPQGFIQWGVGGSFGSPQNSQLPPKGKGKKEKRREREREREREEEGGGVYVFGAMIYLMTLRLAEYHRLKSITPQCH